MDRKKIKIWFVVLVAVSVLAGNEAAAVTVEETDDVGAEGTIPFTPGPLLDDFKFASGVNLWHMITSTFNGSPPKDGSCAMSYIHDPSHSFGKAGYSLKLDYNVSKTKSYSGYVTNLGGANLSAYKYLSFWVKGAAGGEYFKIELHHQNYDPDQAVGYNNSYKAQVYVTDYLDGGVTTSWQKVVIPMDAFANINDLASMKELVITFENWQHGLYNGHTTGTVYIDNISFGNVFLGYVRLDHYGDTLGTCALGGNMGNMPNEYPTVPYSKYSFSPSQYHNFQNGLLSEYDVTSGWAGIYIIIGGGDDGWTKMPQDYSDYEHLNFWIKAKSAGENPKAIVVEIKDTGHKWPVNETYATEISTSWQEYELDITKNIHGDPVSRAAIKEITIIYAKDNWAYNINWGIGQYGGSLVGGIYIDNVEFRDISYTGPDTTSPAVPTGVNVSSSGDTVTVSATASAFNNHVYGNIECVMFKYNDGGTWKTISTDYDTSNSLYSVTWNVSGLAPGSYQVKAVAMDPAGNTAESSSVIYTKP